MPVRIETVRSARQLKRFIRFNYELYKNNPYSVPDLYGDMKHTLSPRHNAAFEFCQAEYYLAYKDGRLAGRVAAIINRRANERWQTKTVRFGWIDFTDDPEVSRALIEAVAQYGRRHGMDTMQGPLGFTDMDAEGMLIEGFDQLGTMATIYNYPYYPRHMEQLGFEKAVDWVEYKLYVPAEIPEKYHRVAEMIRKRYDLRVKKLRNMREIRQGNYGQRIFALINEAFSPLYGYSEMTQKQIDQYVRTYLPILDLRMVTLVETAAGELVAAGISMPSLSRALQKAKGRLWPLGWFHLAKALFLKRPKVLDLLLVGVKREYQSKGVNALLFDDLIPIYQKLGFEYGETNIELEDNTKVQAQWQYLEREQHKRRRAYRKSL